MSTPMSTSGSPEFDFGQWIDLPEDDNGAQFTNGSNQSNDIANCEEFDTAEQMRWLRLIEDAGASHPAKEQHSHTGSATSPLLLTQPSSLPCDSALHQTQAPVYPTPLSSRTGASNPLLWPQGAPTIEPYQTHTSNGLGIDDLSWPASSDPCVGLSTMHLCTQKLLSEVAWGEAATEAGFREEDVQPGSEAYSAAIALRDCPFELQDPLSIAHRHSHDFYGDLSLARYTPQLNTRDSGTPSSINHNPSLPAPSPTGYSSLQESPFSNAHVRLSGSAYDSHVPMPQTPLSPAYPATPGSSGASTSDSPGSRSVLVPTASPRRKGRAPYALPVPREQRSALRSAMEHNSAIALDVARKSVRQFVKDNPHTVEPSIGDPAAVAIIGSNPRFGVPGKSIYSGFFSSRGGKPPFTCHECGRVEVRFLRAVRHQRQEHFQHHPFQCQGGPGHPVCDQFFASEEYAKDHAVKAGPMTFQCSQCPKVFQNSGNLGRHRKRVHHS